KKNFFISHMFLKKYSGGGGGFFIPTPPATLSTYSPLLSTHLPYPKRPLQHYISTTYMNIFSLAHTLSYIKSQCNSNNQFLNTKVEN
ncbi:hypothetical protein, partial [Bacteroides acidifaciens]|uniref:hypothetical protein n=1 Tax=Bacteroides acidifaciens TaxID=85831 RepID=UPI0023D02941